MTQDSGPESRMQSRRDAGAAAWVSLAGWLRGARDSGGEGTGGSQREAPQGPTAAAGTSG